MVNVPRGILAALGLGLLACGPRLPETLPLEIEYGGCAFVRGPAARPTCVLAADRRLVLWVRSALGAELEVAAGGEVWGPADGKPVEGGDRFELARLDASRIVVRAEKDGEVTERALALEPPIDGGPEPGILLSNSARQSFATDVMEAREEAERAVRLHRQSGNLSYLVYDLTFLHTLLYYRFEEVEAARDVLFGQVPEIAPGDGDSRFLLAFYHGQWAINTGDVRAALDELGAASRQAERLGQVRNRNMARQLLARQLRRLGRHEEAAEVWSSLREEIDALRGDCEKAQLLNNIAWDRLLALEARRPAGIPVAELEESLALARGCDATEEINVRVNLALAHLHAGDPERARRELGRARAAGEPGRRLAAWLVDVEGRTALAEGRGAAALAAFESLEDLAAARPGVAWRAAVGRGRALSALGKAEAALEAFGRAEALLDEESRRAPIDTGRETSVAARRWATELYLDLLVRRGKLADALEVARRARSRLFRGLSRDARRLGLDAAAKAKWSLLVGRYNLLRGRLEEEEAEDWAVPAEQEADLAARRGAARRELARLLDEALALIDTGGSPDGSGLPASAPGEVLLAYHPATRGWLAFAAGETGVEVHRAETLDALRASPAELADQTLAPFAERLRGAERVRVLPYGELRAVDFHALPFDGHPLLATAPVVYGLDLAPAAPRPGRRRALLIADPSGSLPAAGKEVADVARALARREGWEVETFGDPIASGGADLRDTARRLRELLPAVDLLHFAGHADFVGKSSESGLVFDRDGAARLTVGDILTRPAVPEAVVLSACATAGASAAEAPAGLGVAHAFLLAGGRVAIGAVRQVDDRTTAALVRRFYASWDGKPESAAAALAAAQIASWREAPAADWASFRVLER